MRAPACWALRGLGDAEAPHSLQLMTPLCKAGCGREGPKVSLYLKETEAGRWGQAGLQGAGDRVDAMRGRSTVLGTSRHGSLMGLC